MDNTGGCFLFVVIVIEGRVHERGGFRRGVSNLHVAQFV